MNTILFLDGSEISQYLLRLIKKNKFFDIKKIILSPNVNDLSKFKHKNIIKTDLKKKKNLGFYDIGFSYYDFKIPKNVLNNIRLGGINFHPSYLPFNRGRHSAFWGIVKKTKLGASSHWLDSNFDTGDIFYQEQLKDSKMYSAKEVYFKQLKLLKKVIFKTIDLITKGKLKRVKQNHEKATYHFASEIKDFTSFNMNNEINNIKLSDIIRGTTFNNKTGIYISDGNNKYFINSNFIIKNHHKNEKYTLKIKSLFGNLYDKKKTHFIIYLNKKKIFVNSTAYLIN